MSNSSKINVFVCSLFFLIVMQNVAFAFCDDPCDPMCPEFDPFMCGGDPCDPMYGGDPCDPMCNPDAECDPMCDPDAVCREWCWSYDPCDPMCGGGDPCDPSCPDFDPCMCGGDPCDTMCNPDAMCDPTCNPMSDCDESCPMFDPCNPACNPDTICDPACSDYNPCDPACNPEPCMPECPGFDPCMCDPGMCAMGACCMGPGDCMETNEMDCQGEYLGDWTNCEDCPGPIGFCCLGFEDCVETTIDDCIMRGGVSVTDCSSADCPGADQFNPVMPWEPWDCPDPWACPPPDEFDIIAESGMWSDPNVAYGFAFEMTDPNTTFTDILDFPVGFDDPFTVVVDQTSLGQFENGDSVSFTSIVDPNGVSEFRIIGIEPLVDPEDGQAFPIRLAFNKSIARFKMRSLLVIDLDNSGAINIEDYALFALYWLDVGCGDPGWCSNTDFDRNGQVDIEDVILFTEYWLWKE